MIGRSIGKSGFWIGLCLGFLLVELIYRSYLYQQYVVDLNFRVATYDNPARFIYVDTPNAYRGNYQPGVGTLTMYSAEGERFLRVNFAVNNLGWRSRFDYSLEKKPGEYRIAIIGDSVVASVNNKQAWPDLLQDELNEDAGLLAGLNATSITVYNISTAGADFGLLANGLTDAAKRFKADLIVVNFPVGAIVRRGNPIVPAEGRVWQAGPEQPIPISAPELEIERVGIELRGCDEPRRLENPACRVSPAWIVPKGSDLSGEDVARIKKQVAWRLVLARVIETPRPLALYELMGRPVIPRTAVQAGPGVDDEARDINYTIEALSAIRRIQPNALIVHTPMYWNLDPVDNNPTQAKFMRLADAAHGRGIDIVDMRTFMPLEGGKDEWYRWYNLPHDGHFSDAGAAMYATAIHKALAAHLGGQPPPD